MKRRWLILGGVLAFVWTLLIHAPAALLVSWFAKDSPIQFVGLEGNISEGRVSGISSSGRIVAHGVHWEFHPLWLLALRAAFQVEVSEPVAVSGRIDILPWGMHLSNAKLEGSLKSLLGAADVAYLPIDGLTAGDVSSLHLKKGIPTSAEGSIKIRGLVWSLVKPPSQLGDFEVNITTESDSIVAHIESPSGPLECHGEARLNNDGSYSWDVQLKAKPNAEQNTQNLLHSMGQPDAQGFYHTKNTGQLAASTPAATPNPARPTPPGKP